MTTSRDERAEELGRALRSAEAFEAWLAVRGYRPSPEVVAPERARLVGTRPMKAGDAGLVSAPRLLTLWRGDLGPRALHGVELRRLQKDAVHFAERVRIYDRVDAPDLFVLACPQFLVVFPLNNDPFARRQRFTVDQVRNSTTLEERFAALSATSMARWIRQAPAEGGDDDEAPDDSWAGLLFQGRTYDLEKTLYGGGRLDEEFVAFMGQERRRLLEAVLDPGRYREALRPVLVALGCDPAIGAGVPTAAELVRDPTLRKQVVAVVDTVLLRLVLYRYLEAQFDDVEPEERRDIGFGRFDGTFDDLVDRTAEVDARRHDQLVRQGVAARRAAPRADQLDLFAAPEPSVHVHDPAAFVEGVRVRGAWYQASAGGDLHRGRLADAADVLQDFLLQDPELRDAFATLIEGTRSTRYSFHYEDLDPRAFQRFYEDTIGTDIGFSVGDARVRVVPRPRNRKEQGAYFTDENVCRWLVERTLGRWFEGWQRVFQDRLPPGRRAGPEDLDWLRGHLAALTSLRVIDPTCGGGIFLRSAYEFLSRQRDVVAGLLGDHVGPAETAALAAESPFAHLLPDANPGAWEWHLLLHVLYGVDVDVKALNVASNLLTLSALTYRPKGLCFPSFINTNLKRGNALVTPVAEADRAAFAARWRPQIVELIGLRARLRDVGVDHDAWGRLHQQATALTRQIVEAETARAWGDVLGADGAARVEQVGVCLYEAEFPEVFFDAEGRVRAGAGFDVVLGNPPWEEPAAEFKQFLPEVDPDYAELSGQASQAREAELLAVPDVAARWRALERSVADYKALLTRSGYRFQRRQVRGKFPGAHTNLYKYATEMAWRLLPPGGRAGLVLDGGLWNDLAASGIRAMLVDESALEAVCGFINGKIFPDVDGRMKFGCAVFRRGGPTVTFPAVFMRTSLDALDRFDHEAATLEADAIRRDPRDSYPVPEVRSQAHWRAEQAMGAHPTLGDAPWHVNTLSEELNAGRHRHFYHREPRHGWLPLLQGTQFNHWGVHDGELPEAWVDPGVDGGGGFVRGRQEGRVLAAIAEFAGATSNKEQAARDWLRIRTGRPELPAEWLRLDWDGYRLAWRDICRNDDRRTLITGIVPPRVALTHTAPFVRPLQAEVHVDGIRWHAQYDAPQLLYLAGMLSSYVCDAVVRSRLSKIHLAADFLRGLPVPPWQDTPTHRRVADLAARLTCRPAPPERPWADYTALAAEVGLTPERDGLVDPLARRDAEVELNAHACALYRLDRDAFRFLVDTLFDTPRHRDTHFALRDAVLARGIAPTPR